MRQVVVHRAENGVVCRVQVDGLMVVGNRFYGGQSWIGGMDSLPEILMMHGTGGLTVLLLVVDD